jgi:hypothetical protein
MSADGNGDYLPRNHLPRNHLPRHYLSDNLRLRCRNVLWLRRNVSHNPLCHDLRLHRRCHVL